MLSVMDVNRMLEVVQEGGCCDDISPKDFNALCEDWLRYRALYGRYLEKYGVMKDD